MPPKRQRSRSARTGALQKLLHIGKITQEGLVELIQAFRDLGDDLPDNVNRWSMADANHARFKSVAHVEKMQLEEGGSWDWEMAEPNKLLTLMVSESSVLQGLFAEAVRRRAPSISNPWTLVIGYDEFSPGGMFDTDNDRKSMNLSYTFLELGEHNIRSDNAWFTPVVVRHSKIDLVNGKWGAMLRRYLRLHLLGPIGLTTAGVSVQLGREHVLIFASLKYMIADLDGHRAGLDWKGANGFRPCLRHMNVLKKNSDTAGLDPTLGFVEITCADPARLRACKAADIYDAADSLAIAKTRVQAGTMAVGRFANLQKVAGLRLAPQGVLLDASLRGHVDFLNSMVVDWVHTALQDGTLTTEVRLLVDACSADLELSWEDVHDFIKEGWHFPAWGRVKCSQLHKVFDSRRCPKHDKIKASASELLGLHALLLHFVELYLLGVPGMEGKVSSFQAACRTIATISLVKQGRIPMRRGARMLREAHSGHLEQHLASYGSDFVIPKHHMMFDVADQWEIHSAVIDAFVVERLHLRVKHVAEHIRNTTVFERSCLSSLINSHISSLEGHRFGDSLIGNLRRFPGFGASVASQMTVLGLVTTVGDIVLLNGIAGVVRACVLEDNVFMAIVETCVKIANVSEHSDRWRRGGAIEAWPADALLAASAWYFAGADIVVLRAI